MADEEAPAPGSSVATAPAEASNEATIESCALGGSESTCNNNGAEKTVAGADTSGATSDAGGEKALELADELMANGSKALKDDDYAEAAECFSRALEIRNKFAFIAHISVDDVFTIRVALYGELSPECVHAYYNYGRALLYKAQEEADPLGNVPKKESKSKQESAKDGSAKNVTNGESSTASASKKEGDGGGENNIEGAANNVPNGSDEEEGDEDSDTDNVAEADEDETDLDLAWKMLDVARAIAEKDSGDTMEKVDILSTLAEVSMEREDLDTSLDDYKKALSMLERLVEPDSRHIAELNFRICLCLEIGVNPKEAILYCQKAISVCQARIQRLMNESKDVSESTSSSSSASGTEKQAEIETLTGLARDLETKLEDLEQMASSTRSVISQILGFSAPKPKESEGSSSLVSTQNASPFDTASRNGDSSTPTVSTAKASGSSGGVTHLGVVGRGVKRVVMNSVEPSPPKKPAVDYSEDKK